MNQKIKLKNDVVIEKEGITKKEHFRLTLMEWRATTNADAKMRPTGSDQSDLHTALANKIYEYFEIDVDKLALWIKDNSITGYDVPAKKDRLIFKEQDALTLAMNLFRFLEEIK